MAAVRAISIATKLLYVTCGIWIGYFMAIKGWHLGFLPKTAQPEQTSSHIKRLVVSNNAYLLYEKLSNGTIPETPKREMVIQRIRRDVRADFGDEAAKSLSSDTMARWRVFEDQGHYILFGPTIGPEQTSTSAIWILNEDFETVYMEIGARILKGKEYPRHLLPYSEEL